MNAKLQHPLAVAWNCSRYKHGKSLGFISSLVARTSNPIPFLAPNIHLPFKVDLLHQINRGLDILI